jgi:hypothetical protein
LPHIVSSPAKYLMIGIHSTGVICTRRDLNDALQIDPFFGENLVLAGINPGLAEMIPTPAGYPA